MSRHRWHAPEALHLLRAASCNRIGRTGTALGDVKRTSNMLDTKSSAGGAWYFR
ncbi:MAG: hypothetical protein ABL907_17870 [Hyphomicrobium sp.]